jgi:hypothetical protein
MISTVQKGRINDRSYVFCSLVEEAESGIIYRVYIYTYIYRTYIYMCTVPIFSKLGTLEQVRAMESLDAIGNRFRVTHYFFAPRSADATSSLWLTDWCHDERRLR